MCIFHLLVNIWGVLHVVRYLRGRIKAGTHGLSAVERAYGQLWSMADRTWQIEHRGEFRLALRRATSLPRGNKRDYVSYKTLVRWRFACALRGSARGFWFIDPLGLRPRGLCTVATRACHVNHAPPSYNYNLGPHMTYHHDPQSLGIILIPMVRWNIISTSAALPYPRVACLSQIKKN